VTWAATDGASSDELVCQRVYRVVGLDDTARLAGLPGQQGIGGSGKGFAY
jgi:hypothetical protein